MEEIYQKVAEKLGVPINIVKHCIDHKYWWIRKNLAEGTYPAILDNHFGTFGIIPYKLKGLIDYPLTRAVAKKQDSTKAINALDKAKEWYKVVATYKQKRKRKK